MSANVPEPGDPLARDDPLERAAAAAALGITGVDEATAATLARLVERDPHPRVRTAALGSLCTAAACAPVPGPVGRLAQAAWRAALRDSDGAVRRRAVESGPLATSAVDRSEGASVVAALADRLDDADPLVAEAAAFALGEVAGHLDVAPAVRRLAAAARDHEDALVREAAVAALGAVGDPGGLDAILGAMRDRPAIRRRAVLALAPFEGPEVDEALRAATTDRDWRVRQAAEDLLT